MGLGGSTNPHGFLTEQRPWPRHSPRGHPDLGSGRTLIPCQAISHLRNMSSIQSLTGAKALQHREALSATPFGQRKELGMPKKIGEGSPREATVVARAPSSHHRKKFKHERLLDMEIVALQSKLAKFILAEVLEKDGVFFHCTIREVQGPVWPRAARQIHYWKQRLCRV